MGKIILAALVVFGVIETGWCGGFRDNGNGSVTDVASGLTWQQEDDDVERVWEEAVIYCEELSLASRKDWRLPNIRELQSIVDMTTSGLMVDPIVFHGTNASHYWSSTTTSTYSFNAWTVKFDTGSVVANHKSDNSWYARCVR